MESNYWSSTTNANNTNNAWHVNFNNGNDNNDNKSNSCYVRAVRGGKCSLLSFSSLYVAYLDCRKRKRGTLNALRFEYRLLANLFDLAREIQQGMYQPSRSVCFVTTKPKTREIFAADFRDRIVHHLVVRELEKIMEPRFIHDSYASRTGKGIHAGVRRLQQFMLQASKNQKIPAWYLQLDIRSFFMSIDKDILFAILERMTTRMDEGERNALLYLAHRILFHDCAADFQFKGDRAMLERVPPHKSLFHVEKNKGLPIGNLTSQFFANVYLNELDQFVKHTLKCRCYLRYVDDFILVSPDRAQLEQWRLRIVAFLDERLALKIKEGFRCDRVSAGADFLGYIVRPDYLLARRRVVGNLKYRLMEYERRILEAISGTAVTSGSHAPHGNPSAPALQAVDGSLDGAQRNPGAGVATGSLDGAQRNPGAGVATKTECSLDSAGAASRLQVERKGVVGRQVTVVHVASVAVAELRQTLASYLGHLRHASTHRLVQSLFVRFPWLHLLFFLDGYHLHDRFHHQGVFRTYRSQVHFFRSRLAGFVTLFRVGHFFESYGSDAQELARLCRLRVFPEKRKVESCAGFPSWRLDGMVKKLLNGGRDVAIVEQGEEGQCVRERFVWHLYCHDVM